MADLWQGKGLGPKLTGRVIGIAREDGVKTLSGAVLSGNQPMLDLARGMGFTVQTPQEGTWRGK